MTLESRYRRLLRWYPRRWRTRDHDVLLGTLLDAADSRGRTRPSLAEAGSVVLHGLAERVDRRTAVLAASVATAISAVATVLYFVSTDVGGWTLGGWAIPVPLVIDPPLLTLVGVALLRGGGLIGARRSVALPAIGGVGGVAGAVTVTLWGLGFDAAEEGRAGPAMAGSITLASFGLAWLMVAALIVVVMLAVLRPAGEPLSLRIVPAVIVGAVGAPALGLAFLQPGGAFVCSAGALAAALVVGRGRPQRSAPPPLERPRSRRRADPRAFGLAAGGTTAAVAATVFCFAAGPLALFGLDGTGAMAVGLGLGALAGIPVLIAAAQSTEPAPARTAILLAAAGLVVNAIARLPGPFPAGDGSFGVLIASGALLAAAAAWVACPRMPGPPRTRVVLAALLAAGLLASAGILLTAVMGFLVPVVGVVVMIRARRPRTSATVATA
ncbi:hypothetical protein [uncultured Amnibacterium sp.]|uniref:hypothetical protein n=1 Tax=uncultured Amnibacterium sp. TaxID=1631851 RepID=UPI0035C96ADC